MGDCCIWALLRAKAVGAGGVAVRCIALEPNGDSFAALQQSASRLPPGESSLEAHRTSLRGDSSAGELERLLRSPSHNGGAADPDAGRVSALSRVDLVKIHAQGAELAVLQGLAAHLAVARVGAILVRTTRVTPTELEDFLARRGFLHLYRVQVSENGMDALVLRTHGDSI
eukprot:TRINITY_DN13750_c1_g1_i1.p1 TRINITY_DN13750_c1_g1~~TRINITY_DN13750_c1_g1_i1.p1  ORF type:complete len:171 (-),score=32.49 TRINITY_DN13750_c1_g1_i1:47-559(-)